MIKLCAIICSLLMFFIFIVGLATLKNKNPEYYKKLLIIMIILSCYELMYCFQIITIETNLGFLFFYLKKICLACIGYASIDFIAAGCNYSKLIKTIKIPLMAITIAISTALAMQYFYGDSKLVQNVGWQLTYYSVPSMTMTILAIYLRICCVLSLFLFIIASRQNKDKYNMKEYCVILYLSLPSFIYFGFFSKVALNFDLIGFDVLLTIFYMVYIVSKENGYRFIPISKGKILDLLSDGILILDQNTRIKDYNNSLTTIFKDINFPASLGLKLNDVFKNYPAIMYTLKTLNAETLEIYNNFYTVETNITHKSRNSTLYAMTFKNSTDYINSLKNLSSASTVDYLTKLKNVQFFIDMTALEIAKSKRYELSFIILCVDIDNFEELNKQFGYLAGDSLIVQVGNLINREIRMTDLVSRFQNHSFLLLLTNTDVKYANSVAERIRNMIETSKFNYDSKDINATASIGLVQYDKNSNLNAQNYVDIAYDRVLLAKKRNVNFIVASDEITKY